MWILNTTETRLRKENYLLGRMSATPFERASDKAAAPTCALQRMPP
jgi:hypothetical protein